MHMMLVEYSSRRNIVIVSCSYCGKALLRNDARFCSQCGTALAPSSSLSGQESLHTIAPWLENTDKRKRVLHEQIAQQPFSSPQSKPSNYTITTTSQNSSPVTPIPVSLTHEFEEEINTPLPKKPSSIVVVRENTPRPITLALTPLPDVGGAEEQIEHVKSSKKSSQSQLAKQHRGISNPSIDPIRRLSWFEIICILIAFLIIAGGLIWFLYTSSKGDSIVNPMQNFTDPHLGIALQYPNQWIETSDSAQSTVSFYDNSSQTTQIKVARYSAGMDIVQFMQEQALQFGMTKGQFGMSMPFAGAAWQQLQGQLIEKGADYTGTILGTQHKQHLYMIAQLAPQGVYTTEEKLIFTPLCMSFHFL
jgi:zinc-ribbon domain